jgi:uncharacterized CHY-type Zn-finger protein
MKKLTIEYIKEQFEKEGYVLLLNKYVSSEQKLCYICKNGHKHSISWNNWKSGRRCPYCAHRSKLTIEFIVVEFAKEGYKLLSTKYKNNKQKLEYICKNGHKHGISWHSWQAGHRCPYCDGQGKPTIEFIKFEFAKEGYQLLDNKYINAHQKISYICPKGHKHNITWHSWRQRKRCPYCTGVIKKDIEFIKSEFEKEGYKLLTKKYINARQKLDYVCPKGHKYAINWTNWLQNRRCPECIGKISKGEIEVKNFIEFLGIEVLANNRNQIFNLNTGKGLELDIFMPTLNKAIEYNGEYWHQDKSRDLLKQELCELKNIVMKFLFSGSNFQL